MLDEFQDEITDWVPVDTSARELDDETILAIAFFEDPSINSYLKTAERIGRSCCAVYLNENPFNIKSFISKATSLRDEALLKEALPETRPAPKSHRL